MKYQMMTSSMAMQYILAFGFHTKVIPLHFCSHLEEAGGSIFTSRFLVSLTALRESYPCCVAGIHQNLK